MEVNSHSLFSKWFSESGKLVMKLFDHIHEVAEDRGCFVCVLIDEVESIVMARSASNRSNEPGDAVRVVNSVLTSLDSLRRKPNVLVLCTSNLAGGIDAAFTDRMDLQMFIGPPLLPARFAIIHSCMLELMSRGVIQPACELSSDVAFAARSYQAKVEGRLGVDEVEIHELLQQRRENGLANAFSVTPTYEAESGHGELGVGLGAGVESGLGVGPGPGLMGPRDSIPSKLGDGAERVSVSRLSKTYK